MPPELQLWWARHQKEDREREAREEAKAAELSLRTKALEKLTPQERHLLGIWS